MINVAAFAVTVHYKKIHGKVRTDSSKTSKFVLKKAFFFEKSEEILLILDIKICIIEVWSLHSFFKLKTYKALLWLWKYAKALIKLLNGRQII